MFPISADRSNWRLTSDLDFPTGQDRAAAASGELRQGWNGQPTSVPQSPEEEEEGGGQRVEEHGEAEHAELGRTEHEGALQRADGDDQQDERDWDDHGHRDETEQRQDAFQTVPRGRRHRAAVDGRGPFDHGGRLLDGHAEFQKDDGNGDEEKVSGEKHHRQADDADGDVDDSKQGPREVESRIADKVREGEDEAPECDRQQHDRRPVGEPGQRSGRH